MYTGADTVEWLYSTMLQVDEEWSQRTPGGFRWWGFRQAQTIEVVGQMAAPPGEEGTGYYVSVSTEFLREVDLDEHAFETLNVCMLPIASLAGLVHDPVARGLDLRSLLLVHEDIAPWANRLLALAAVMQLNEAWRMGTALAPTLGAEVATSPHPVSGFRPGPDDMCGIVEITVAPDGQLPPRWTEVEFTELLEDYAQQVPCLLATGGGLGFTAEFPWGDGSSLCQMYADQQHPTYGSGLLVLQSFPVGAESDAEGVALALSLNAVELLEGSPGYGLGSYTWKDNRLWFSTFYPNALYQPNMLPSLYYAAGARARALAARFTGRAWDESFLHAEADD